MNFYTFRMVPENKAAQWPSSQRRAADHRRPVVRSGREGGGERRRAGSGWRAGAGTSGGARGACEAAERAGEVVQAGAGPGFRGAYRRMVRR